MQKVVIEKPYQFIPPYMTSWRQRLILLFLDSYLWRNYGIKSHEIRHAERLDASIREGHGIMITANHSRPSDPMACGWLRLAVKRPMFCMASYHLFEQTKMQRWLVRACGGFSIYREGTDTKSVNFTVKCLSEVDRPVVIFPEGALSRSNDVVFPMLDGPALIARLAARRRAKQSPPGKVVIHPLAMKYFFQGDLKTAVDPVLQQIEERLAWQPRPQMPVLERIGHIADALLCLRELEYFGSPQTTGNHLPVIQQRIDNLIEHILRPQEEEWAPGEPPLASAYARVLRLRSKILPDMVAGKVTPEERERRWRQLRDSYVANQLGCYPRDYLAGNPSPERILETVEKIDEDLTDAATFHGPLHLVIQVGEAIEVEPRRERGAREDPLTEVIRSRVAEMIDDINANPPG